MEPESTEEHSQYNVAFVHRGDFIIEAEQILSFFPSTFCRLNVVVLKPSLHMLVEYSTNSLEGLTFLQRVCL